MKKFLFALAALSLLMACTPEENGADNNQSGNGGDKIVHVTGISLDRNSATIKEGEYITLVATVTPSNADNKTVSWSSSSDAVAKVDANGKVTGVKAGSATITATAEDDGKTAACSVVTVKKPLGPCPSGAVDLGLSVYWGTTNIGASKPEDYGDYYAWGETTPKEDYSWSTYKWGTSSTSLTKYNTDSSRGPVDNKTVLEPEDDVAHVKLGGKWRMPTDAEWSELLTKCSTWTCVTNYNGSGINGRLVKATNGNSIFLPAAGFQYGTDLCIADSPGMYWSSSSMSLDTDDPSFAWNVSFGSDHVGRCGSSRYSGFSVRPVSE